MTQKRLKELTEDYLCFYDYEPVNEFHEGVIYTDNGDEYNFEDIDFDYFYAYEKDEYELSTDIRELIQLINKAKKEINKFDKGKTFFGFIRNEYDLLMTEESLDELFDFENLERSLYDLEYCKFNLIKH
jgi:hypothetical protein